MSGLMFSQILWAKRWVWFELQSWELKEQASEFQPVSSFKSWSLAWWKRTAMANYSPYPGAYPGRRNPVGKAPQGWSAALQARKYEDTEEALTSVQVKREAVADRASSENAGGGGGGAVIAPPQTSRRGASLPFMIQNLYMAPCKTGARSASVSYKIMEAKDGALIWTSFYGIALGSSAFQCVPPPPPMPFEGRPKKLQIAAAFNAAHEEGCACCVPQESALAPGFWKTVGFCEKAESEEGETTRKLLLSEVEREVKLMSPIERTGAIFGWRRAGSALLPSRTCHLSSMYKRHRHAPLMLSGEMAIEARVRNGKLHDSSFGQIDLQARSFST
eukprot:Skav232946  [mRNA]  locus=scaffold1860:38310:50658:- [translate_table: standard]